MTFYFRGEDSQHQFKHEINSIDALAAEITAFANGDGGKLIIGIGDQAVPCGLSPEQIQQVNLWISNASSQKIEPPCFVTTSIHRIEGKRIDEDIETEQLLRNLKLVQGEELTLAGALLFGGTTAEQKPQFGIKATIWLDEDRILDRLELAGCLQSQYRRALDFLEKHLQRLAAGSDVNDPARLEIPLGALKEALANALVHRDYFINTQIQLELTPTVVRVVSPGALPNTITVESICSGIHMERNPILLSFLCHEKDLGYSGRGCGIPRLLRLCRERDIRVDLENNRQQDQFTVTFHRPGKK